MTPPRMAKLPYNHTYKLKLEIGLANGAQAAETNPATESSYSEAEWNDLPRSRQEAWLSSELKEWANGLIDYWWEE